VGRVEVHGRTTPITRAAAVDGTNPRRTGATFAHRNGGRGDSVTRRDNYLFVPPNEMSLQRSVRHQVTQGGGTGTPRSKSEKLSVLRIRRSRTCSYIFGAMEMRNITRMLAGGHSIASINCCRSETLDA